MLSYSNKTTLSPKGKGEDPGSKSYGYIVATGVVVIAIMLIVALVFVYRMYRKRSGPLWITKFYVQDLYCSMTNDDVSSREDHFILGFSNPIMQSASDLGHSQDSGGIKILGYKPLDIEKQPGGKDDSHEQYKFLFPREKLVFGPEIGTGWFGQVYEGEALRIVPGLRKTKVIIKKLKEESTSQRRSRFLQETEMLCSLNHKNVLGIIGKATEQEPFLVLFERSPMGNLKEFLISHKHNAESLKTKGVPLKMAIDIATGLHYLHSNSFFHSDLAARNCVVDADLSVKIGDYGISRYLYKNDYHKDRNSSHESVPIRWLDPESVFFLKDSGLEVQSPTAINNVWSYGVTVWEIIELGRQPYEELTDEEVIQSVIIDQLYQLPEPKETGILANQLYETMRWCWIEASRRPSIQDMMTYLTAFKENCPFSNTISNESSDEVYTTNLANDNNNDNTVVRSEKHDLQMEATDTIMKEKTNDIDMREICDSDSIPVTVINSVEQEVQDTEMIPENKQKDVDSESRMMIPGVSKSESECELPQPPPPVTYIGDPSEGLAEYERRIEMADPVTAGNEIVEVRYSGSENCASGYVVLPGELVRRKSSLRRENTKSRGQSVHFPANILDLRVVHRYYKEEEEEEEEEDGHVLSHDDVTDKPGDRQDSRHADFLITGQASQDNVASSYLERPMSPVEKKIKKASRRRKLDQHSDEWLFSIDH